MLTIKQLDKLENIIYKTLIANPDIEYSEYDTYREEARNIIEEWIDNCNIEVKN